MKSLRHLMPAPAIALLICAVAGCGGSSGGGPEAGTLAFKPRAEALCRQINGMVGQKAALYEKGTKEISARPGQGDAIIHRVSRESLTLAKPIRARLAVLKGLKAPAATREAFGFMDLQKIRALDHWAEEANLPGCRAG